MANIELLEKAKALMLSEQVKGRFDIADWGDGDPMECGTRACLAGWMASTPDFGIKWSFGLPAIDRDDELLLGDHAVRQSLGITRDEARDLCFPDRYGAGVKATPADVAAKLDKLIEKYKTNGTADTAAKG